MIAKQMRGIREDLEPSIQNIDVLVASIRDMQGEVGKVAILQAQVQALQEEVEMLRQSASNLEKQQLLLINEEGRKVDAMHESPVPLRTDEDRVSDLG